MMTIENTGLVLEGGGMRGVFTAGVLDAFMEAGIEFPYVVGVSAGACNACSFISRQKGRAHYSNIDMMAKYGKDYLSVRNLLKTGCVFNVDLLYHQLPYKLWPWKFEMYYNSMTDFEIVTTNMLTGKAEYFSNKQAKGDHDETMKVILASSSLPYVSKTVSVGGVPMLDGGIVDSIPVKRAMEKGYNKNIVILTRNFGYRKKLAHGVVNDILSAALRRSLYHKYPEFVESLKHRGEIYNEQLELVEQLESEGKVTVIRPQKPVVVDRVERNVSKLEELYQEGYKLGCEFSKQIIL